jgi:two-component system sensor histidine kinase FlrB
MKQVVQAPGHELKAQELQRAFDAFNQVSLALTQSYQGLQGRVESLTAELAVANGELRRQYEEKEALSERLSLLLKALPAGVVVLDSAARVSEANPAASAMFAQAMIGESWPALAQAALIAAEAPDEWQLGARRLAIAESPLDSAGGRILLIHDVTAAHTLKAELERNQRLVAMGEMAASLAHQLRTPLATALLYSANLAQPGLAETARLRFADKASAQLKRLERLIQEVLLFARGESIGRDSTPARQLLAEAAQTVEPLFLEKGIAFRIVGGAVETVVTGSRKGLGRRAGESARECPAGLPHGGRREHRRDRTCRSQSWRRCGRWPAAHHRVRYRRRDRARNPGARLRALLHDQRAGDRAWSGHRAGGRACPWRGDDGTLGAGRRLGIRNHAAGRVGDRASLVRIIMKASP